MDISLYGGSAGQPGEGLSTRHFEIWLKGVLELEHLSLCESSVQGSWREGSLAGNPEGQVEIGLLEWSTSL
jgi:hypothetical protein